MVFQRFFLMNLKAIESLKVLFVVLLKLILVLVLMCSSLSVPLTH